MEHILRPPISHWTPHAHHFSRPLGLLEHKFHLAALEEGTADCVLSLILHHSSDRLIARIVLAWGHLRAMNPSLTFTITDVEGMEGQLGGMEFRWSRPEGTGETFENVRRNVLRLEMEKDELLEEDIEAFIREKMINGSRKFLDSGKNLSRLIIVKSGKRIGLIVIVSHVIADGQSLFRLMQDFLDLLADPARPTPTSFPSIQTVKSFLSGEPAPRGQEPDLVLLKKWGLVLPLETTIPLLPLSSESLHPVLPLSTSSPHPSLARQHWFYAISSTLRSLATTRSPRRVITLPRSPSPTTSNPYPQSRWENFEFSTSTTGGLIHFSRRGGYSPSMLLYSLLAVGISNYSSLHLTRGEEEEGSLIPVLIGFPMSLRPFLSTDLSNRNLNDLAIRLGFGSIQLPSLPTPSTSPHLARTINLLGRSSKIQFANLLAKGRRDQFLFRGLLNGLERLEGALGLQRERGGGKGGPSSIGASMPGDVDRLLSNSFLLPSPSSSSAEASQRIVVTNLRVCTRLHPQEILVESWKWDDKIFFSIGFDERYVPRGMIRGLLDQVRALGEALGEEETREGRL